MNRAFALTVALATTTLAACGGDDDGGSAADTADTAPARTVEISMTDMAYAPASIDVTSGETVRFVFRNDGAVRHEAVVGNLAEQEAHHADMAAAGGDHDGMDMGTMDMGTAEHSAEMDEMHGVIVEPGETVEMTHTFDTAGPTMIGCHEPGHWEAGMRLDVDVA
jgi:uncharacterized cupredoxin-like copper-binding protein